MTGDPLVHAGIAATRSGCGDSSSPDRYRPRSLPHIFANAEKFFTERKAQLGQAGGHLQAHGAEKDLTREGEAIGGERPTITSPGRTRET